MEQLLLANSSLLTSFSPTLILLLSFRSLRLRRAQTALHRDLRSQRTTSPRSAASHCHSYETPTGFYGSSCIHIISIVRVVTRRASFQSFHSHKELGLIIPSLLLVLVADFFEHEGRSFSSPNTVWHLITWKIPSKKRKRSDWFTQSHTDYCLKYISHMYWVSGCNLIHISSSSSYLFLN